MGIRGRLLIMLALVLAIGGAILGTLQTRTTTSDFMRLVDQQRALDLPPLKKTATDLERAYRLAGWPGVTSALSETTSVNGSHFLVVLGDGEQRYSSRPDYRVVGAQSGADVVRVELVNAELGNRYLLMEKTRNTVALQQDGQVWGRLLRLSLPGSHLSQPQQRFLQQTRASLIALVATVLLAALIMVYFLGRRITRPLQQLAVASERISRGDLGYQVPVGSNDEVGQLARRFNQMSSQLQHTQSLRKRMVSDIAHELRTPITGMRCNLESLRDGVVDYGPDTVDELYHDLLQLQRLVEDLQELSLAEAGELRFQASTIELAELLDSAVRAVPFSDSDIRCLVRVAPSMAPLHTDGGRLRQVLINLLNNALAHSPPGGLVEVEAKQGDGCTVLSIADQGEGVAESELEQIFERFYRTDAARQRPSGGSGLGLAISRQLVQQMGGQISAQQRPQRGMVFVIKLPEQMPAPAVSSP